MDDTVETEVIPSMARLRASELAPTESIAKADLDEALLELAEPVATIAPIERAEIPARPRRREDRTRATLAALLASALLGAILTGLLAAAVLTAL